VKRLFAFILIVLTAVAGYFIGIRYATSPAPQTITQAKAKATYVCPMHSNIVRDHPGTCPICGMDLVLAGQQDDGEASQIHVDTATQQKLGVRLAKAEPATLTRDIQTYGTVVPDESAVYRVTPNIDGVLAKLYVHGVGQHIAKGELIYELSSTDALNVQYEYLDTVRRTEPTMKMVEERRATNRRAIADAPDAAARTQAELNARNSEEQLHAIMQPLQRDLTRGVLRLKQIGFSEAMIKHLIHAADTLPVIPVHAHYDCVVKEVMARPGMSIMSSSDIFTCVDTHRAWLEITLYPDQLAWARDGDRVTVEPEDGESMTLRLSGLNSMLDSTTRTVRARVALPPDRVGYLGDYVRVTVHAAPREVLSVPKSALIRTGHGNFVMRAMGKGHFMPVQVLAGIETDERIAIRDGLAPGDQVAVNGQFLLDASASIADAAQRLKGSSSE
jgi:membrane fusion protein, copper/silver efflux system